MKITKQYLNQIIKEELGKSLKEATLQRVTSKVDGSEGVPEDLSTVVHKASNGSLFLIDDSTLKHVKEQHKKVGTGSVLHPSINIESIVDQISKLPLNAQQVFYQIQVPNAGYRLVIDKAEAEQLKTTLQQKGINFTEDTVKKPEAGGFIDVPRLNINADLKDAVFSNLVTNLLDVLLPTVDFDKIYGATPQEKDFAIKHVKKVIDSGTKYKQAFKEKKLFTFVTAFPTKKGFVVPKPSEWKGNYYIVYPAGAAQQSVKENKMKISKQYLKEVIKEELNKISENATNAQDAEIKKTAEMLRNWVLTGTWSLENVSSVTLDAMIKLVDLKIKESDERRAESSNNLIGASLKDAHDQSIFFSMSYEDAEKQKLIKERQKLVAMYEQKTGKSYSDVDTKETNLDIRQPVKESKKKITNNFLKSLIKEQLKRKVINEVTFNTSNRLGNQTIGISQVKSIKIVVPKWDDYSRPDHFVDILCDFNGFRYEGKVGDKQMGGQPFTINLKINEKTLQSSQYSKLPLADENDDSRLEVCLRGLYDSHKNLPYQALNSQIRSIKGTLPDFFGRIIALSIAAEYNMYDAYQLEYDVGTEGFKDDIMEIKDLIIKYFNTGDNYETIADAIYAFHRYHLDSSYAG